MTRPALSSAPGAPPMEADGFVYLLKSASCGKTEHQMQLCRSLLQVAPTSDFPEHHVACSKSYALGRWRGAMGKVPLVQLAASVSVPSYFEGYDDGSAERAEREAARRSQARLIRSPSWTR